MLPGPTRRLSGKFGRLGDSKREVLMEILQSSELCLLFRQYLHEVYSSENLTFLLELEDYKSLTNDSDKLPRAKEIFDTYLATNSVFELAVDISVKTSIERRLFAGDAAVGLFDAAELEVFHIIESDLLPKFMQSKTYLTAIKNDNSRSFFGKKKNKISLKSIEKTKSLELLHRFQTKEDHMIGKAERDLNNNLPLIQVTHNGNVTPGSPKEGTNGAQGFLHMPLPSGAQGFLSFTKEKDIEKLDRAPVQQSKSKKGLDKKPKDKHKEPTSDDGVDLLTLSPLITSASTPNISNVDKRKKEKDKKNNRKTMTPLEGHSCSIAFMKLILDDYQNSQQDPNTYVKAYHFVTVLCEEEIQHSTGTEDLFTAVIEIYNHKSFKCFLDLIEYRLNVELSCAESPESKAVILREESVLTKLVSKFFNLKGSNYLSSVTVPLISTIISCPSSLEVSPEKICNGEDLQDNINKIIKLAQDLFTNSLCMQIDLLPPELRYICFVVRKTVERVSPELVQRIIGNLFFLRFICPSLVTATKHNGEPLTKETRRALVVLSKMLQNLVTGVEFDGSKESYMVVLNGFIKDNKTSMAYFIEKLTEGEEKLKLPPSTRSKSLENCLTVMK
eukprot:TRINITY_DN426_c0_g1_i3.p1 TRINITY_DN426_c0_g1~~TRINITY_DN426_c0_g1_i3.p1  ORF type:complete len:615 (-),score=120.69 TRINITY_DN426_c0_g1_i3:373-2217(-)